MIATNQTEMKRKKEEKTEKKKEELIDLEENEEEGLYNFKPPKKIHFQVAPDNLSVFVNRLRSWTQK